jgi:hypothetical protein
LLALAAQRPLDDAVPAPQGEATKIAGLVFATT